MKAGLFRGIAFLLLGIILGAAGTNALIGQQVDHLTLVNITLQDQLEDAQNELEKLKESSKKKKKQTITAIETYLILTSREGLTEYDELRVKLEAAEKVKNWLSPLLGQDVAGLDTLWIPSIVDNREIEANGNKYRLRTHLVIINEKLTVYLKATLVKGEARQ
ncbi:MAG: hypothetical protein ACOY3U_08095 [Bacillota bacterium]